MKNKWCFRIHKSQLPKSIKAETDEKGFIHGYLIFGEKDYKAMFMNDNFIFECSRPVIITQTHLLIRYATTVFTGHNRQMKQIGEFRELVFFFNNI